MSGKAGNGEGSIYKRADGRWEGAVSLGNGRRRRFYGKTHSEVKRKLVDVQKAVQDGLPVIGESVTTWTAG
jgi:hypothetical protein